jgi:hypothetical protein
MCACANDGDCLPPETCGGGGPPGYCGCTHDTCLSLHLFCGITSDHCTHAPIDCNQDAALPGETDTDCGGNVDACPTRCANGKNCKVGTDCQSGFCSLGVCCDNACTDACMSCSLSGYLGTCKNVGYNQPNGAKCPGPKLACDGKDHCGRAVGQPCTLNTMPKCVSYCNTNGVCN